MKFKLTKTAEYTIDSSNFKNGEHFVIEHFDVIHCTLISKSSITSTSSQVYINYQCYGMPAPDNIPYYVIALDQNTIRFGGNIPITNINNTYLYKIECYNVAGNSYDISIEDIKYKTKVNIPYFNINENKFTLLNINANTVFSNTDPAIYTNYNGWEKGHIGSRWIIPCLYTWGDKFKYNANDLYNQKQKWASVIDSKLMPLRYDWSKSTTEPTPDQCYSVSQYRDKYYTFSVDLWQYDETASQNFEYYASSGNDKLHLSNISNIGQSVNIVSDMHSLDHYGLAAGDIITNVKKIVNPNGNSTLSNQASGAIYINNINDHVSITGKTSIDPIYPNTNMISNFAMVTKSNFNGYVGDVSFTKEVNEDAKRAYLNIKYDDDSYQSIEISSAQTVDGYKFNYGNMGLIFSFNSPDTKFIDQPDYVIIDDMGESSSNVNMITLNSNDVYIDPDHIVGTYDPDINANNIYKFTYRISSSYTLYDPTETIIIQNYNSELSEDALFDITLIGTDVDKKSIYQYGVIISDISIIGYVTPQKITITYNGNNKYYVTSSVLGELGYAQVGVNHLTISDNVILSFTIDPGSNVNDFVAFMIDDLVNIKVDNIGVDVDLLINRPIHIDGFGSAIIYNKKMIMNIPLSLPCTKSNDRYQLRDIITNECPTSGSIGELITTPGGSVIKIVETIDTYVDLVFTNTAYGKFGIYNRIADDIVDNIDVKITQITVGTLIDAFEFSTLYGINDISTTAWAGIRLPTPDELSLDNPPPHNKWLKVGNINGKLNTVNDIMIKAGIAIEHYTPWATIPRYIKCVKYISQPGKSFDLFCADEFNLQNIYSYAQNNNNLIRVYVDNENVSDFDTSLGYIKINDTHLTNSISDIVVIIDDVNIKEMGLRQYRTKSVYNKIQEFNNGVETNNYYFWAKGSSIIKPPIYFFISNTIKSIISVSSDYELTEDIINKNGSVVIYSFDRTIRRDLDSYATKLITTGITTGTNKIININEISNININNSNTMSFAEWVVLDGQHDSYAMPQLFWTKILETLNGVDSNNTKLPYSKYIDIDYINGTTFRYGFEPGKIIMEPYDLKKLLANIIVSFELDIKYNNMNLNDIQNIINLLNDDTTRTDFIKWLPINLSDGQSVQILLSIYNNMTNMGYSTKELINKSSYINVIASNNINVVI